MPKVSVIMPVYNTDESFLREAIDSILCQTYTDFEFLIINDGSTNNSEDVILSYKDSRIKYIKNEQNFGLIKTLNKGLAEAQGEYIARMDADDVSLPERFKKQVDFLEKNSDIDILGTWFNCFPKNRVVGVCSTDKEIKESLLVNSNNIGHPTVMVRKYIVDTLDVKYDENDLYVEDYALWLSLIDKVKFANIPEVLLNYRLHNNSICQTKVLEQSLNVQEIMVQAQGKYFGLDNKIVLESIKKLKNAEMIDSKNLLAINMFVAQVQLKMKELGFSCNYEINRVFYKHAIRQCKKDSLLLKLLWSRDLNNMLRINFSFKILNSIRIWRRISRIQPTYDVKNPKVSVVMALYNTPIHYLTRTVKSLLSQSFKNFELIIIDDASTINYKEFFEKFKDNRIKYFKLDKNKGPGNARNIGIKKALGEYIAIADSDDIYKRKRLEHQVAFLDKNPKISLLSGASRTSNNNKKSEVLEFDRDIKTFMLFNSALTNPAIMFRKNIFAEKNLFYPEDINFAEDYSLWIDAMFAGVKMANLKNVLMIYVRRQNQLSKAKADVQEAILKSLYRKICIHLELKFTDEEIDLHHNIDSQNFGSIKSAQEIANWLDKIIKKNKELKIFDEQILIVKKNNAIEEFNKCKKRIFKLKLLEYNFCIYKPLKLAFEKRK